MNLTEKWQLLKEQLPVPVLFLDQKGLVLELNRQAEVLLGKSQKNWQSRPFADLICAEDQGRFQTAWDNQSPEKPLRVDHLAVTGRAGKTIYLDLQASPIELEGEQVMLVIGQDVTEARILEQRLVQAQKMEALGQLAGGIAHDFNNLLTIINGYSEILINRPAPGESFREFLEEIKLAGERAGALTRKLLAFSRNQVLQPRLVDLNSLVEEIEKLLRRLIGANIEITSSLPPNVHLVKVDAGQVEQILINLAVNARDAMPDGGKITLETANVELDESYAATRPEVTPGSYVMLAVSDTGCGMDEASLARIFEPFFTTKEPGKGTGLGLATVYGIVKQSNGHIFVYSEPGFGSVFKIYFPRIQEPVQETHDHPHAAPAAGGWETVLLVEDEDGVRRLARRTLEMNGYNVLEGRNGAEALDIATRHPGPIHLLVTDVIMPKMSGRELVQGLASTRPEMKVLYISGYTGGMAVTRNLLEIDAPFLEKPFTPDILKRKVRDVLGESMGI